MLAKIMAKAKFWRKNTSQSSLLSMLEDGKLEDSIDRLHDGIYVTKLNYSNQKRKDVLLRLNSDGDVLKY